MHNAYGHATKNIVYISAMDLNFNLDTVSSIMIIYKTFIINFDVNRSAFVILSLHRI